MNNSNKTIRSVGIITNTEKDKDLAYTAELIKKLSVHGIDINVPDAILNRLSCQMATQRVEAYCKGSCSNFQPPTSNFQGISEQQVLSQSDVLICLGGDGTFLKVARSTCGQNKLLLGINLGGLGFLTEFDRHDIDAAVDGLIKGSYTIEDRMMIEAVVHRDGKEIARNSALNDIVISKGLLSRILHIKTYIGDSYVDTYRGDGLIVATPTGSTAYSLSAGGPIVEPNSDLIIITPICPHTAHSRPIVLAANKSIKACIDESYRHHAMVTFDGQDGYEIRGADQICISRLPHTTRMIKMVGKNFFDVLRAKIYDKRAR